MGTKTKAKARSELTRRNGREPGGRGRSVPGAGGDEQSGGRGQVADVQRARMLTAMVHEISERGAANVSVAHVVARSGVSRRTFYEIFEDREDCFLAAFDDALGHVAASVIPAYEAPGIWRVRVRSALTALLEALDYDRATGRLLVVESLAAGPRALRRRQGVLAQLMPILEQGQSEVKANKDLPALTAEGVVGGVLSVLHARLVDTRVGSLLELANPLMGLIVLPYLGPVAARKEIEQPTPKHSGKRPRLHTDPLQDLPMRFTYRTMRVLISIAELGGQGGYPSNRAVGEQAGIADQGQTSKLLARLHGLGLIENRGGDAARGEPNAWKLTTTGKRVHDSIAGLGG